MPAATHGTPLRLGAHPSPNHDARPPGQVIDMLVLHYTGMPTAAAALARLCDPTAAVSAHWLVLEDGTCLALVPEDRRAWHAGLSVWRGERAINARSVGVEIVNPGHEFGYRPFPAAQQAAVVALCRAILDRHPIPPRNVVGHSDIAPTRKEDPGELFDWPGLAAAGVGLWPPPIDPGRNPLPPAPPLPPAESRAQAARMLADLGYDTSDLTATLLAFQRRYRPRGLTGRADGPTLARLRQLLAEHGLDQASPPPPGPESGSPADRPPAS